MEHPDTRPVFLNLFRIRQSVPAVASILHRVSGVLLSLAAPFTIYLFGRSLESPAGYQATKALLSHPALKVALVLLVWALAHHVLAGVRFLFIDAGIGGRLPAARRSAWVVVVIGGVAALAFAGALL